MNKVQRILCLGFFSLSLGCHTTHKPHSEVNQPKDKLDSAVFVKAHFAKYVSAMGKGKGLLFSFEVIASDSFIARMVIDSIVLGGQSIPFKVISQQPLKVESNYYKLNPEPLPDAPKPPVSKDALIDEYRFYPAHMFIAINHQKYPILIDTIILQKP